MSQDPTAIQHAADAASAAYKRRLVELPHSFRPMTMAAALRAATRREPGKIALIHEGRNITYRDFMRRVDQATDAAIGVLGLKKGQNAVVIARNCIEYLEIICGLPEAGVPVATVNPRLTLSEIKEICEDAQAAVIFVDAKTAPVVRSIDLHPRPHIIEIGPQYEAWLTRNTRPVQRPLIEEWDIWSIPYTSGTTGRPKGVMLSHRARIMNFLAKSGEYGCFSSEDRFLSISPMNHGPGTAFPLNALIFGGSVEILDRFDPVTVLRKLKHDKFTGIFMVPTHFHGVFEVDAAILAECRRPPIRTIISSAAALSQEMKEKVVDYFGEGVLHELFSSTENSLVSNLRPADQLRKTRCVGLPFAQALVSIRNEQGKECAPAEVGELFSLSPYTFSGYWNRPEETAAAFHEGWVTVGDLARRDDEGYIYIVDRKKDMIITGGVNIYPREIEQVLATYPGVTAVAVVGAPHPKWGEIPRVFVTLAQDATLTLDDVRDFCSDRLAAFKIPKELRVLESMPRNGNGKILKTALRGM